MAYAISNFQFPNYLLSVGSGSICDKLMQALVLNVNHLLENIYL